MCTVTFIPTTRGIYLTSNRDESAERSIALPPNRYTSNGRRLIYPQDQDAGGSWIALKDNGDSAVLLNGAFTRHERQSAYRKSRGLIFLALVEDNNPYQQFASIDLDNIESFTLVLFSKGKLWECRWNGYKKHINLLDASRPYIWSSATLYDSTAARERKRWFQEWCATNSPVNTEKVVGFHQHTGKGDLYNGLVINRGNKMRTVSITSLFISPDKPQVFYRDLLSGTDSVKTFGQTSRHIQENIFQKSYWSLKKAKIKITNWEYWPAYLVYGPLYLYWCWLSVKARSFFFFSAANPGIQYSGFVQEKKSDIYKLIPQQYYPRTRLCTPGEPVDDIIRELKKEGLAFPLHGGKFINTGACYIGSVY